MKIVSKRKPSKDKISNIPCGDCFQMSDGNTRMAIQPSKEFPADSSRILTVLMTTGKLQYFPNAETVTPVQTELTVF